MRSREVKVGGTTAAQAEIPNPLSFPLTSTSTQPTKTPLTQHVMSASSSSITKRPSPLTPQPLCLLCSSSIQFASKFATNHKKTSCCQRIICGTCVETKGRLASWEPCLACEGKWKTGKGKRSVTAGDGGREEGGREEQFVLGDEDDEDEKDDEGLEAEKVESEDQEKAADLNDNGKDADDREVEDDGKKQDDAQLARRHIVLKGETLMGIALKYRLDVRFIRSSLLFSFL
jgi:hypothetical protein